MNTQSYASVLASAALAGVSQDKLTLSSFGQPVDTLNKSSAVAEMGDRLATIDTAEKCVGCCTVGDELGPRLTQCCLGRGPPPYQVVS